VAGLTDAGAILTTAGSDLVRRHSRRQWTVLAEQPLAVRAEPGEVELLMIAPLDAADAPCARHADLGDCPSHRRRRVVAIATDPARLPLRGRGHLGVVARPAGRLSPPTADRPTTRHSLPA
jgi:hypothetical protein